MPARTCRVCGRSFLSESLLCYENLPGRAQFLPDAASIVDDKGVTLDVRQCGGCGLVQLSNDPVPYFRDVIRAAGISPEMTAFREAQFGDFVRRYALGGKKLIEIGCGRGEYLEIMARSDMDAHGLEHAEDAVADCVGRGLSVSQGFIDSEELRLENGPFEAFMILNFLEHLPDAGSALRGIRSNLVDGGLGLVEVPSFDMMLRKGLFAEFTTDHLFYFTETTLRIALELNGFEVLDCSEVWHNYILSATVRSRPRLDMSGIGQSRAQLREELHGFIDRVGAGGVAVWGAGHQALAVLALAELGDKVRYVVDSAPFKQGKYTPATHVPIMSPQTLDDDPVEAVIVMAASYSDEVAGILRDTYGPGINVVILRENHLEPA